MQREVFYIAGYDPKGYRYYYSLFKKNLSVYKSKFNVNATLSKPIFTHNQATWQICGQDYSTNYNFLAWNDLVLKNWSHKIKDAVFDAFMFFAIYVINGRFLKFGKESIYQLITGFYPFLFVIFSFVFAFFAAFFTFKILLSFNVFLAFFAAILLFFLMIKFLFKFAKKIGVFWIARICSFCARWDKLKKGEIEARLDEFSEQIYIKLKENLNNEKFEAILLTHSVGTILGIEILAKIIKKAENEKIKLDKLKIITLGECIPLTSFQPFSKEFNECLSLVSSMKFTWLDYTSIIDGACFPQVDFFKASKINARFKPKFLSTRFHAIYEKERYKKLKNNKFIAHFLYLYSPDFQGGYDFFNFVLNDKILELKEQK